MLVGVYNTLKQCCAPRTSTGPKAHQTNINIINLTASTPHFDQQKFPNEEKRHKKAGESA